MFVTIFNLENEKEDFVASQSHFWLVSGTKRYFDTVISVL